MINKRKSAFPEYTVDLSEAVEAKSAPIGFFYAREGLSTPPIFRFVRHLASSRINVIHLGEGEQILPWAATKSRFRRREGSVLHQQPPHPSLSRNLRCAGV